ncbi:MAG: hypothetical protein ACI8XM_001886 [Haloarculaceae archaeon]|jgi:hypothetical protein
MTDSTGPDPAEDDERREREPAPQSESLRRQQAVVANGAAVLTGIAVIVAGIQQFPDLPVVVPVVAGILTTAILYVVLSASVFDGSEE